MDQKANISEEKQEVQIVRSLDDHFDETPDGWRAIYEVNLPFGASFYFRSREAMIPFERGPALQRNVLYFDGDLNSQGVVIVGDDESRKYCLIGALTAHHSLTYFTVAVRQKSFHSISVHQPNIKSGSPHEELVVLQGNDWMELLRLYAEKVQKHHGVSFPRPVSNTIGYCSWYYSYEGVSEGEFLQSLNELSQCRETFPTRYVQIDDGYQPHHGDWLETNARWPSPLKTVADSVLATGFTPGIWTMPLLASTASKIFRENPDWFVKDKAGNFVLTPGWSAPPDHAWACLDASRNDVLEHLKLVYSTLYDWGFRYFKFDGLGLSYPDGVRSQHGETGISAMRSALRVIRQAVKDSVILSCGGPYLATIGLADHTRLSADTGILWKAQGLPNGSGSRSLEDWEDLDPTIPCLYNALTQSLEHWWMFDRWYRPDPDVIIVRDEKTHLTLGEARMSALMGILTGICFTSDRVGELSEERLALLEKAATLRCEGIQPVLESGSSQISVFSGTVQDIPAAAIFNWSSSPKTWVLADLGLEGDFKEKLHPIGRISGSITLNAHDAVLLVKVNEPL